MARRAKLLWLNYPNNPTGAVVDLDFFGEAVSFARSFDLIICHDAPYSEITFDGYVAPSFLQAAGAREVGIEFHSLSKTYNMTGWRLGWAAGNAEAVRTLGSLKSNLDSGVFQAVQYAGIAALSGPQDCVRSMRQVYNERRDIVVQGLRSLGWQVDPPRATIYVWAPVPPPYTSTEFAELVLEKAGVVLTPGIGYGRCGEGWFRISLTTPTERLTEAFKRLKSSFVQGRDMLKSMTGYGRGEAEQDGLQAVVEIRSVNHRFCEAVVRIARPFMRLEERIKEQVLSQVSRGHLDIYVTLTDNNEKKRNVKLDKELVLAYHKCLRELAEMMQIDFQPDIISFAQYPGVIVAEEAEDDLERVWVVVESALTEALQHLVAMRAREGEQIARDFAMRRVQIANVVKEIGARSPSSRKSCAPASGNASRPWQAIWKSMRLV